MVDADGDIFQNGHVGLHNHVLKRSRNSLLDQLMSWQDVYAFIAEPAFFYARITAPIHQLVEQWLSDRDARPQIAVRGHFSVGPEIVRNSDLATIFPESLALRLHRAKDFRLLALPFDLPPIEVKVHSHARFANDKGIRWMCETTAEILGESSSG